MSVVDHLCSLNIPRSDAKLVAQVTQAPQEALQLLGRTLEGTIFISRKDISEWYSEQHQKYYYAVKSSASSFSPSTTTTSTTSTTDWLPPACFAYSEWVLDSQMYQISLTCARDIYLGLDAILERHPSNISWPALKSISKILGNIADCGNTEEKYRSIRLNNEKFSQTVYAVSGALDILLLSGFTVVGESVVFMEDAPLGILKAAAARAKRLVEKKGHSGEAKSDGSSPASLDIQGRETAQWRPPSPFYSTPGFLHQERIYHCDVCNHPINDGSERLWTGRHDAPLGEYRYECSTCLSTNTNFNLCQGCWDRMQSTGAVVHISGHNFQHIGPRESRHHDYYGTRGGDSNPSNPWGMHRIPYPQRALDRLYGRYPR